VRLVTEAPEGAVIGAIWSYDARSGWGTAVPHRRLLMDCCSGSQPSHLDPDCVLTRNTGRDFREGEHWGYGRWLPLLNRLECPTTVHEGHTLALVLERSTRGRVGVVHEAAGLAWGNVGRSGLGYATEEGAKR
jgi:hypothetical protein